MAESKKTKVELRETAEALCREYNDNIQNGNFQVLFGKLNAAFSVRLKQVFQST